MDIPDCLPQYQKNIRTVGAFQDGYQEMAGKPYILQTQKKEWLLEKKVLLQLDEKFLRQYVHPAMVLGRPHNRS